MDTIPPLAWIAIAFVIIVIIVMNIGLFAMMRSPRRYQMKMPRSSRTVENLKKAQDVLRDPFAEERRQLNELSHLVDDLSNHEEKERKQ